MTEKLLPSGSMILDYANAYLFGINLAFNELKRYQDFIESFLENEKKEFEKTLDLKKIEDAAQSYKPHDKEYSQHLLSEYYGRHFELSELYPHNFRASYLVNIISFIEHELKKICDYYAQINKTDFTLADLKGNSEFEKANRYLQKACKINVNNLNPEWSKIDLYRKIRNIVVHEQGILTSSNNNRNEIYKFCDETKLMKISPEVPEIRINNHSNQLVIISREFNNELLKLTESFFEKLLVRELKLAKDW